MRLDPNPKLQAEIDKTRELLRKAYKARGISLPVIAKESGVHTNTLGSFLSGDITNPMRKTLTKMREWADKNRNAKPEPKAQLQKDVSAKIRAAYQAEKSEGKNLDEMALAAGVNRTVLSQLMNGTYTRQLRPVTMKNLNTWADKALK